MPVVKMKETRHICGTTLYSCIFFECNTSNNDAKLEIHNFFYRIPVIYIIEHEYYPIPNNMGGALRKGVSDR